MNDTLFFEGAGSDFVPNQLSDVGNFRIRTAFTNLNGIQYYIELGRSARPAEQDGERFEWAIEIHHLYNIRERRSINCNRKGLSKLCYNKEDIVKWINKKLNCCFSDIEVLDTFYGYQVHRLGGGFNLMEDIEFGRSVTSSIKEAFEEADYEYHEYEKVLGI